jgi:hypothetical protein
MVNETASIGDAFIRQRTQPFLLRNSQWRLSRCRLRKSHRNCFHRLRMDSSTHIIPVDSEIVKENWVAADSEIITEIGSRADAWIHQRSQTLLTQN